MMGLERVVMDSAASTCAGTAVDRINQTRA